METTHFNVLIIGAGLSGIGVACHLHKQCPGKTYVILERRQAIGGTWDLFRYPGIRSDSDMYTFGFRFRPWTATSVLADGPSIRAYINETAQGYGVDRHIHFGLKVLHSNWSSVDHKWTITAQRGDSGELELYTANFLVGCTGYYNYDAGYRPAFPDEQAFRGQIVHPQHWPADLDYSGKNIIVIGSGATAVTLVPSLCGQAAKVTMLQRSPSYILSLRSNDVLAGWMQKILPTKWVYHLARGRNIALSRLLYRLSRSWPRMMRRLLLGLVRKQVGDCVDMRHFTPRYNPWEQRLCIVPDGNLFKVLRNGKADIVTDQVERFTEAGILLESGKTLAADIIITATGLDLQMLGGATLAVDGETVTLSDRVTYKGVMLEGVPNAVVIFGYTNISWTLKVDIASEYVCRLLSHMDRKHYVVAVARDHESCAGEDTVLGSLSSGYIQRAAGRLPRQGRKKPWFVTQDYRSDAVMLRNGAIEDGVLEFGRAGPAQTTVGEAA